MKLKAASSEITRAPSFAGQEFAYQEGHVTRGRWVLRRFKVGALAVALGLRGGD